jgi:hypothetical protein
MKWSWEDRCWSSLFAAIAVWIYVALPFLYQIPVTKENDAYQREKSAPQTDRPNNHASTSPAVGQPLPDTHAAEYQDNKADKDHSEFWSAKLTDWLLVAFTLALVFFTRQLARSTNRLWEAGERQMELIRENAEKQSEDTKAAIELARAEFISTHRPRLILRQAFAPLSDNDGTRIQVHFTITNVGDTKAWIVSSEAYLELFTTRHLMLAPNSVGKSDITTDERPLKAGEAKDFILMGNLEWDNETRFNYSPDFEIGLFFVGHVIYRDELGTKRQMAFRRRYTPSAQRFLSQPTITEDHDYSD